MHLLIPYVHIRNHPDPLLEEFTYGDVDARARKLKDLKPGDYVFFHTSRNGKKYITAYFVVDRVLETRAAANNRAICLKYKNPHILEYLSGVTRDKYAENVVLFGDPVLSQQPKASLLFDKTLARKLSLNIEFPPNRSETQAIGSATRAWRELTDKDARVILSAIEAEQKRRRPSSLLSSEEVAETIEKDVEEYLVHHPELMGKGLKCTQRQLSIDSGRIDLLFEDKSNLVIVEIKFGKVGRDALSQIRSYLHEMKAKESGKKVSGVLVCSGVMPAFEQDFHNLRDIRVLMYGWEIKVKNWS